MSIIEFSMLRYIDNMILPCLNEIRQELPLDRIYQKTIAMLGSSNRLFIWKTVQVACTDKIGRQLCMVSG